MILKAFQLFLFLTVTAFLYGQKTPLPEPLQLPPGLIQVLPLHSESSYFGDALRAVHCPADEDNPFGTCGNLLFGGLAMTDTHLSGSLVIRFHPPIRDVTRFEVTAPGGLAGEDGILAAPRLFQLPVVFNVAVDAPGFITEGDLNLVTGEVTNLRGFYNLLNTALIALGNVNPNLEPPIIEFPGIRGSALAEFHQRPDGFLDFSFFGSTFLPLGNSIGGDTPRFPLQFCGPRLDCASIPAAGTSLHPHLRLSTKAPEGPPCGDQCPDIPTNTIWELTTYTHNTHFGDDFTLNIPELGGGATGRSHLLGRIQVQFGERFGDSVPIAVSSLPPAGLLAEPPESPLSFPGLSLGMLGHDEFLRFPNATYFLEEVAFADEPFDISLGAVNLKTGKVIGDLLYRGFIAQDLLFVLLEQNDGRIAADSFSFSGPASFEAGRNKETVFRFNGNVFIPFETFRFPSPDFIKANSFIAGPGSELEPFLRIQAMHVPTEVEPDDVLSDSGSVLASTGDQFSFNYSIPCDPKGRSFFFEYQNQSGPPETAELRGTFRMESLVAVSCTNSRTSTLPPGQFDTVSFTGFGSWSDDDLPHVVTAQFSQSEESPYISILIDGGFTSNVNTKPENIEDALP